MWIPHSYRNARPSAAPGAVSRQMISFSICIEHARAEGKSVVVCLAAFTMSEEEGIWCHCESAHRLATAANILGWASAGDPTEEEVASVIKGGLRRGKCQYDKQALQKFLCRVQVDDA